MQKTIVFITSTSLATNPRCVKEIQLALESGYNVKVLACHIGGWSAGNEQTLQHALNAADIQYVHLTRANKWVWLQSKIVESAALLLYKSGVRSVKTMAYAESRRSYLLLQKLAATNWQPQWVIAHNPSAFYAAYRYAKQKNARLGIDIEDYHPGENQPAIKQQLLLRLMQQLLPLAAYNSYASPLIMQKCMEKVQRLNNTRNLVVNNAFRQDEFVLPAAKAMSTPLRFVWFSQNIDYKRGLEPVLQAMDQLSFPFTLTLIGNMRQPFFEGEVSHRAYIQLVEPLTQPELHRLLSTFDAGLAAEDASADENRNICLTNKIWAYYQSGLYIVASNTPAQQLFLNNTQHGVVTDNTVAAYVQCFEQVNAQLDAIRQQGNSRFQQASAYAWQHEAGKLLLVWEQ